MSRRSSKIWLLPFLGVASFTLVSFLPSWMPDLPVVDVNQAAWHRYRNETVGYSVELPTSMMARPWGDDEQIVSFDLDGTTLATIQWLDDDGTREGIWFSHSPIRETSLAGRPAQEYRYQHFDGPFGIATHAVVASHRGRPFGVERYEQRVSVLEGVFSPPTQSTDPDPLFDRIIASLELDEENRPAER